MQRITISLDDTLAESLDTLSSARGYQSRSEAVRDAVRQTLETWQQEEEQAGPHCIASLSFIYNPQTRALAQRLSDLQLAHHDLIAAVTSVPLDHDNTLASMALRGETAAVRAVADQIRAERGVRFGALNLVRVELHHGHDHAGMHSHPASPHFSPHIG